MERVYSHRKREEISKEKVMKRGKRNKQTMHISPNQGHPHGPDSQARYCTHKSSNFDAQNELLTACVCLNCKGTCSVSAQFTVVACRTVICLAFCVFFSTNVNKLENAWQGR